MAAVTRWSVEVGAEPVLARAEAESFYQVYLTAFGHLREHAAARQVLTADEFFEEMDDPRVTKFVARADGGDAVGLSTLVTALEVVPWISPEYYAARYPDQAARGAIYYVGFMMTHPGRRSAAAYPLMVNAILTRSTQDRAALLWDVCGYNQVIGFANSLATLVKRQTGAHTETLDSQTYYGVVLDGA